MTGLDIWASLLSTGVICTIYTTVVSGPVTPPRAGAPRPPTRVPCEESVPLLQPQLGLSFPLPTMQGYCRV